jgi:hypothetical protein
VLLLLPLRLWVQQTLCMPCPAVSALFRHHLVWLLLLVLCEHHQWLLLLLLLQQLHV